MVGMGEPVTETSAGEAALGHRTLPRSALGQAEMGVGLVVVLGKDAWQGVAVVVLVGALSVAGRPAAPLPSPQMLLEVLAHLLAVAMLVVRVALRAAGGGRGVRGERPVVARFEGLWGAVRHCPYSAYRRAGDGPGKGWASPSLIWGSCLPYPPSSWSWVRRGGMPRFAHCLGIRGEPHPSSGGVVPLLPALTRCDAGWLGALPPSSG